MKKIFTILILALATQVTAQEAGDSKSFHQIWTFIYDRDGNTVASEKAAQGKYYFKTVFNFSSENKYEFSLDEFDSSGTKLTQVTENGIYLLTATQFTLTPKSSETIFNPAAKQNLRSVATTRITNPVVVAIYSWLIEKNKTGTMASLNITTNKPGYREGVFAPGATSHTKAFRQLPQEKQRSIARSM